MLTRLSWLDAVFQENSNGPFLHHGAGSFTYDWLRRAAREYRALLDSHGIAAGSVVALEGDYAPHVIAQLLALIDRGCIAVPLNPAARLQRDEFIRIAEVQHTIHFDESATPVIENTGVRPSHELLLRLMAEGDPGLVLFSSGSTGKSKAALHNFRLILEKFKTRRPCFVTMTFLMLDHIGGINTLFFILSNGGSAVSLKSRLTADVCSAIEKYRVELLPTSPTFLNLLLLSEDYKHYDLSSLKRITYGTEVMPAAVLERLHQTFPSVELQQTYGLSELGILRSKSRSSDSLWVKLGGEGFDVEVREGTLWIKARSAMLGYLNAPPPFSEDGWFNTGDAVEVDGEYIRILGRKSEIINVGGEKVYPVEVEHVLPWACRMSRTLALPASRIRLPAR